MAILKTSQRWYSSLLLIPKSYTNNNTANIYKGIDRCQHLYYSDVYALSHNVFTTILWFRYSFFFNLRIIALQYCVGFCHITTWISNRLHMSSPSQTSLTSTPLGYHTVPGWAPGATQQLPPAIYFTHGKLHVSVILPQFAPPSPSPICVHKSVLCFWFLGQPCS